jgi:hypothetical protein
MVKAVRSMIMLCTVVSVGYAQIKAVDTTLDKSGGVNWETRTIVAVGIGAPNPKDPAGAQRAGALRAAKMVALRNALEIAKGIFLNSSSTVEDYISSSDVITTHVNGFIKGFQQKGRDRYMSDGSVEITMEIPLDGIGGITDMLVGDSIADKPPVNQAAAGKEKKEVFSGLIIDCKGLAIKPALSPKIVDEEGKEIYGSACISKEWAVKYGIVGYAKEVKDAAKLDRVGKTPGQIKALKATGKNNTDVILSKENAAQIRSAAENMKFLSECRVVVVID